MSKFTKWVSMWGNATSIIDQKECRFSKDLTLRYPVYCPFSGDRLKLTFSNLTGTEPIILNKVRIAKSGTGSDISVSTSCPVLFGGNEQVPIAPGKEVLSDEVPFSVTAGDAISVSIYLENYTDMKSGVLITGPLSGGYYSYGDFSEAAVLPEDKTRYTNWFYFLNLIQIRTSSENHALVCYGDSITAQSWPDHLTLLLKKKDIQNLSVIRRAVSGTRILREYSCITYAAYGLSGEHRFSHESDVPGADLMIIQHGINDIIHPVGTDVNIFRPWSDMPSLQDLTRGITDLYIKTAKEKGYTVYSGTLLPILGWRTYAPFREELRCDLNRWLRSSPLFDGCMDFDAALSDPAHPEAFLHGYDSGDHLHPSDLAYKKMAETVYHKIFES